MPDLVQNTALLLRAGYGVEDIAVISALPVSDLRVVVRHLRQTGQLHSVLDLPHLSIPREALALRNRQN